MLALPRGHTELSHNAPLVTARWASIQETLPARYQSGAIWLGTVNALPSAIADLENYLADFRAALEKDPLLNPAWRIEQLEKAERLCADIRALHPVDIGVNDDRHLVTIAGSRSGKGTSAIIPNLCLYPGSVIVIDPKGENATITAARRGEGSDSCAGLRQKVYVLDPFGVADVPDALRAAWNPLLALDLNSPTAIDEAGAIADALVERGDGRHAHWDETARAFIKGLILHVVTTRREDYRHLLEVRKLLTQGDIEILRYQIEQKKKDDPNYKGDESRAFQFLLDNMLDNENFRGVIQGAAQTLDDMADEERGSVLSTARRNTEFLDSMPMYGVLEKSTLVISDLKRAAGGVSIYLCLPAERMATHGRWLRLMIALTLETMYRDPQPPKTGHPVLFLLEEFAALGHLESIEKAAGYAAGFGVKLWAILQDLAQLKKHYSDGWETFLGNAGVVQLFGNSDLTTLDYISKRLGKTEVTRSLQKTSTSIGLSVNDPSAFSAASALMVYRGPVTLMTSPFLALLGQKTKGQSSNTSTSLDQSLHQAALLTPDEIEMAFARERRKQLVLIKGQRPVVLDRRDYYSYAPFAGLYAPSDGEFTNIPVPSPAITNELTQQLRAHVDEVLYRIRKENEYAKWMRRLKRIGFWLAVTAVTLLVVVRLVMQTIKPGT